MYKNFCSFCVSLFYQLYQWKTLLITNVICLFTNYTTCFLQNSCFKPADNMNVQVICDILEPYHFTSSCHAHMLNVIKTGCTLISLLWFWAVINMTSIVSHHTKPDDGARLTFHKTDDHGNPCLGSVGEKNLKNVLLKHISLKATSLNL